MVIDSARRNFLLYCTGIVQSIHLIALVVELQNIIHDGKSRLLAPAPEMGWSSMQFAALFIMGTLDMLLILGFVAYVWMIYLENSQANRIGLAVLSGFQITALAYALVIIPSRAITVHPVNYAIIALAFLPVFLLWIDLLRNKN
ncbi:MAG: hypothetical protein K9M55_05335 [Candidatus Marinimicrobia bacterium]|nr:hypothetical protein [Candidatus Neomarinimicrobiota bacterium]